MGCNSGSHHKLFYPFNLEGHAQKDRLLHCAGQHLDLCGLRQYPTELYSGEGRPYIGAVKVRWESLGVFTRINKRNFHH